MRSVIGLLIFVAVSAVPRIGSAQVSVTSPAAGAESSYRKTVISWNPIPGASSYHLEIDDDPNFGSPEVDVTVAGTSYALSGQQLKLNGQQSWAAYVRINGTRWNAGTFTPSYFGIGDEAALAVTSQNLVFLAFQSSGSPIQLTASSDWSMKKILSLEDTFNADPVNLAVDEFDVAHAFWVEQRLTENRVPYYTNSATGWELVRIPGTVDGCLQGSSFAARGRFEIFLSCNNPNEITRWTIANGTQFARTALPNSADTDSASATRDGVGNVYVASTREAPNGEYYTVLQGSGDGFIPHTAAAGRSPTFAVTREGELHVLRWGWEHRDTQTTSMPFVYSNALRGFQTWTALPIRSQDGFYRRTMPLLVDAPRGRLYAAIQGNSGVHICSAAHTGVASTTGTSWTCTLAPNETRGSSALDGALAPDGTVHFVWSGQNGLAYANSLGSFLATNFSPQITFGAPSSTASAAIVPAAIADSDDDDVAGDIHVGRFQDVVSLVEPGTTEPIFQQKYTIMNYGSHIRDAAQTLWRLEFRVPGATNWSLSLERTQIPTFPATVEVRQTYKWSSTDIGTFQVLAWDDTGATISQNDFVASAMLTYSGALPSEIDISSVPAGNAAVAISASDGTTSAFRAQEFTKASGQTRLLLTTP